MFEGTETMRESRGTRKLQVVQCGLDWGPGFCSGPLGVTIQGLSVPGCNQDGFEFQDPKSQEEPTSCKKKASRSPQTESGQQSTWRGILTATKWQPRDTGYLGLLR